MFVILVYDASSQRDPKILKLCRQYLNWVQNSVFEGDMTEGKLRQLMKRLEGIIEPHEDSIIIYTIPTPKYSQRLTIGTTRASDIDIF